MFSKGRRGNDARLYTDVLAAVTSGRESDDDFIFLQACENEAVLAEDMVEAPLGGPGGGDGDNPGDLSTQEK